MPGKVAVPLPSRVLHAVQARALCPCLATALAWSLLESHGPPNYHARVADRLPDRGALIAVRPHGR